MNFSKAIDFNGLEINRAGNNLSADRLPPEKISSSPSICFADVFAYSRIEAIMVIKLAEKVLT